jgi:hypothetical protein
MREIRQSGSVGGEPQSNAASLPLLNIPQLSSAWRKPLHCRPIRASGRVGYSATGGLRRPGFQNVGPFGPEDTKL